MGTGPVFAFDFEDEPARAELNAKIPLIRTIKYIALFTVRFQSIDECSHAHDLRAPSADYYQGYR
jgi:hypothetical protein